MPRDNGLPCIFQTGAADFHASRRVDVGFTDWARRILMNEGGRAIKDKRFRYWVFNTNGRRLAVSKRQVFLDRAPGASDIKLSDIAKADKQSLVRKMIAYTAEIPGTLGESAQARQRLETMVDQIERETPRRGDNEGVGRIPALFTTLTAPVYKWERSTRLIRRWKGLPDTVEGGSEEAKKPIPQRSTRGAGNSGAVRNSETPACRHAREEATGVRAGCP